jgi:hypothetical protein
MRYKTTAIVIATAVLSVIAAVPYEPFVIAVKDSATGRPLPLARLVTTNHISLYTDAQGRAAFFERGLMNQDVYFTVSHSDFERSADFFGNRGKAFNTVKGGAGEMTLDVVDTGIGGCWNFDEASGTTAGEWMHGYDGTVFGAPQRISAGISSGAIRFDGVDDYISLPRYIEGDFSISFYINTTTAGPTGSQWYNGSGLIDAEVSGTSNDFGIALTGTKICFGIGNSDTSIKSTTDVTDGSWHLVTATRDVDNGEIALYIDCTKEASATANRNLLTAPAQINAGRRLTGTNYFTGALDELKIFGKTLNPQEVYALGNPAFIPESKMIEPFIIKFIDSETGRGMPLVRLDADCGAQFITDSGGIVAIYEPALMDRTVTFHVFSHGCKAPDGGQISTLPKKGGYAEFTIESVNIAQRMYRITGAGIYNHTRMALLPAPLKNPTLSGKVVGQDTSAMTEYKGKYHWLWGDTSRPAYPLGNFKTSGATSPRPQDGGLDPSEGVDLTYYVNDEGFSKGMYPRSDAGLVWMNTMATIDDNGAERLIASYWADMDVDENGFAVFNDTKEEWESLVVFSPAHNIQPAGAAYKHTDGYFYVCSPYPSVRIRSTAQAVKNPAGYEGYSCLVEGTAFSGTSSQIDRDPNGNLLWGWKANTSVISDTRWQQLLDAGLVSSEEEWNRLRDIESDKPVQCAGCAVQYNEYRGCWSMVTQQIWGTSFGGEIWYSEAPAPEGPWSKAIKIITHDNYTFYNVQIHPEFQEEGGKRLYLEGTYVNTYTNNIATPRYNYNQMMYRLDLTSPKLRPYYCGRSMGAITREYWGDIPGNGVSNLLADADYPLSPDKTTRLLSFDEPVNVSDNFGTRVRGYLYPPETGEYTFWIAGDDECRLYLSADALPANKSLIASLTGYTSRYDWEAQSSQQSAPLHLEAGRKYFILALHKDAIGGDHMAVSWQGPSFTRKVIEGKYLSQYDGGIFGDADCDGVVDISDITGFVALWLRDACALTAEYDINGDCLVSMEELSALAGNWLKRIMI